jgi:hypothetical protein
MRALNEDLGLPFVGDMEHLEAATIESEIEAVWHNAEVKLQPLRFARQQLENRAAGNFSLVRYALAH